MMNFYNDVNYNFIIDIMLLTITVRLMTMITFILSI